MPPVILEFFPPSVIALNEELLNHPPLTSMLRPDMSLEEKLGHIAAYCDVGVDGYYLEDEIETLIYLLLQRLKNKSAIVIHQQ